MGCEVNVTIFWLNVKISRSWKGNHKSEIKYNMPNLRLLINVLNLFLSVFAGVSLKLARVRKCKPFFILGHQMGVIVRGGPSVKCGNWG